MLPLLAGLLLCASSPAGATSASGDIISRMDRSMIPYGGGGGRSPFQRYRYPVYTKRVYIDDAAGAMDDHLADPEATRFLQALNFYGWPSSLRYKKLFGMDPSSYEVKMTPQDINAVADLYRHGKRQAMTGPYDLRELNKIYEAGKRSSEEEGGWQDDGEDSAEKRQDGTYFDLRELSRMQHIGKRSVDNGQVRDPATLETVAKRSGKQSMSKDSNSQHLPAKGEDAAERSGGATKRDVGNLDKITRFFNTMQQGSGSGESDGGVGPGEDKDGDGV